MAQDLTKNEQTVQETIKTIVNILDVENVDVRIEETGHGRKFEIYVPEDERGKVIGRGGQNINALRTIAKAQAIKLGVRHEIHVKDC